MKPALIRFFTGAFLAFCFSASAFAQLPSAPLSAARIGSIVIYVSGEYGKPLPVPVDMRLTPSVSGSLEPIFPREIARGWIFENLEAGDTYDLDVEAKGYTTVHRSILLPDVPGVSESVIVYMKPIDENLVFHAPSGQFALPPKAQKEVQNGLKDFQSSKFSSGEKHLTKALQLAPANPYVNYVAGMGYLLNQQLALAEPYLEKSVSIDSRQVTALVALGNLRFQKAEYAGAIQLLEKAVEIDPTSWKAQWILADCYLHERTYQPALDHAKQALELGKEKAGQVQLLLAEAYAGLGNPQAAKSSIDIFLKQNPHYPTAAAIRSWLAELEAAPVASPVVASPHPVVQRAALTMTPVPIAPPPPVELPPKEDWAPKDIDAETPLVISGASCSLPKVLEMAAKNAERTATNLQEFEATEESEIVEVKRNKSLETPQTYKSRYMALIDRSDPKAIQIQELHDPPIAFEGMPGGLADVGAPALVLAFHPIYRNSFEWSCEGLGEWNSQPAWIIRFSQKPDVPTSLLSTFETLSQRYPLPLKGRAWVAANGGQIMHLETDLVRPVTPIALNKQHFIVDYAPVPFPSHKVIMWLPENVNLFLQYGRHYLHYYHYYSNFTLFWVGTSQKIGAPKEAKQQN